MPDLVFSEMKFLQKHKDQPDVLPQSGLPKKKHKKNQAHAREERISAFFTAVQPTLVEKDVNIQAKEGSPKQRIAQGLENERDVPAGTHSTIPTVELPDNVSFPGFGSRGPRHENRSYVSRSESITVPSATSPLPGVGSTIGVSQLNKLYHKQGGEGTNIDDSLNAPARLPHRLAIDGNGIGGRSNVPSMALANRQVISQSHSRPQPLPSPRLVKFVNGVIRSPKNESIAPPSSMSPPIPHFGESRGKRRRGEHVESAEDANNFKQSPEFKRQQNDLTCIDFGGKVTADVAQRLSSSLERILQKGHSIFKNDHQGAASLENSLNMSPPIIMSNGGEPTKNIRFNENPQGLSTLRFVGGEFCGHMLPKFSGPSIYEEQEQRQQKRQAQYSLIWDYYPREIESIEDSDELAYDDLEWEGAFLEKMRSHNTRLGMPEENMVEVHEMAGGAEESDKVVGRGFWQPHKLY